MSGARAGSLEQLNIANNADAPDLTITELDEFDMPVVTTGGTTTTSPSISAKTGELKFEEKRMASATSTKIRHGDNYSSEEATANASHSRRLQGPDGLSYQESGQANSMKARLEVDGVVGEKAATVKQVSHYSTKLRNIGSALSSIQSKFKRIRRSLKKIIE